MTEFADRLKDWACTEQATKLFEAAQQLAKDPGQRMQIEGVRERLLGGLSQAPVAPAEAPPAR